jgi:hypothetical protein
MKHFKISLNYFTFPKRGHHPKTLIFLILIISKSSKFSCTNLHGGTIDVVFIIDWVQYIQLPVWAHGENLRLQRHKK